MSFKFKVFKNKILIGVKIIKYSSFKDKRGFIYSSFNKDIKNKILKKKFQNIDDKIIYRKKNTLTGIHGDNKTWKLVSCVHGSIELVLVNCKKNSKTFGKYIKIKLTEKDFKSILIPPLVGNSYLCLTSNAIITYKFFYNGKYNDYNNQFTYSWKDKRFNIKWSRKKKLILSKRDNF